MNQFQYCTQQLASLLQQVQSLAPFNKALHKNDGAEAELTELEQRFFDTLTTLSQGNGGEGFYELGQWMIGHTVANYPDLTPVIPRDLFWFFGGDCLHYMPDEEIQMFQKLDEACHSDEQAAEQYQDERAKIFGLH